MKEELQPSSFWLKLMLVPPLEYCPADFSLFPPFSASWPSSLTPLLLKRSCLFLCRPVIQTHHPSGMSCLSQLGSNPAFLVRLSLTTPKHSALLEKPESTNPSTEYCYVQGMVAGDGTGGGRENESKREPSLLPVLSLDDSLLWAQQGLVARHIPFSDLVHIVLHYFLIFFMWNCALSTVDCKIPEEKDNTYCGAGYSPTIFWE